jgi:predicted ATPase
MLTGLKIGGFKCFDSLSLPLTPLTLLTGFNAAGKSTTLQSILLIAQALRSNSRATELNLNGSLVRLGTLGEVLNSRQGNVMFSVEDDMAEITWNLQVQDRTKGDSLQIQNLEIRSIEGLKEHSDLKNLNMLLPYGADSKAMQLVERLREIIFLSASRIGTAEVFPTPEEISLVHANVGIQGEFAPWWFQQFLDEDIDELRCHPSDRAPTLRRQFNAWASELFPGAEANAQTIEKTSLIRLELRIGDISDWRRPSNIGYGLTYAFPVIVAGLLAKPKQILIIDSPEAHLHPLGQSRIGYFLCQIAAAGVQVIIETHSDHVLNGVRLAVQNKKIAHNKVAVHFFTRPSITTTEATSTESSHVVSPLIDSQGNLSEWPNGFFDQSEKDLARLAGWE